MSAARARRRSAVARRRAVVLALGLIALAAIVPALAAVGPPPAGVHAQPVLGVADEQMRLMGAGSGRRGVGLPGAAARPSARRSSTAGPGSAARPRTTTQLAFLRWTPRDRLAVRRRPLTSGHPLRRSARTGAPARVTPNGGGAAGGRRPRHAPRARPSKADSCCGATRAARFRALLPSFPAGVLRPGEALATERRNGPRRGGRLRRRRPHGRLLRRPRPRRGDRRSSDWDGEHWSREPVEVPAGVAVALRDRRDLRHRTRTTPGCWRARTPALGRGLVAVRAHDGGGRPALGRARPRRDAVQRRRRRRRGIDEVERARATARSR